MTKVIIDNEVTYTVEISNSAADVQIISGGTGTSVIEEVAGSITTLRSLTTGDNLNITTADGEIDFTLADDISVNTITGDLFGAVDFNARNTEGVTITKGTPVYIKGHSGSHPEVGIAVNDDAAKMPAFGIAAEDISDNQRGDIATFGEVTGFDTSAFAVGDELYVSNSGTIVNTRPTSVNQRVQKIAKVIRSHASEGILFLSGAGRTNDVPNVFDYNIFPSVDGFVDLGSETKRFRDLHAVNVETTNLSADNFTGDVTGNVTGNLSSDTYITGHFIPSADTTYDLGSTTNKWRSLYLSGGSLYIEGQKVVGSTDGSIDFTTDDNENMTIFAGGNGTEGTMTLGSAGLVTNIQDDTVNIGPAGNDGTINIRGTLETPDTHIGDLELSSTLIHQKQNQNLEIRTGAPGYLHANVSDFYVGPLTGAVKIDESTISSTVGNLTVTGDLTGNADTATTATNITVEDESTDTTCSVLITRSPTGNLPAKSSSNLTYNALTGVLTTTQVNANVVGNVTGNLTGDVTGNVTGNLTATTVTTSGTATFSGDTKVEDADFTVEGSATTKNTLIGDQTIAASYAMHGIRVSADDTCWAGISLEEYVGGANKPAAPGFTNPTFGTEIIGGTPTAKAAVASDKRLFVLQSLASNATDGSLPTTANFRIKANTTEAQTATNRGTQVTIDTIATGTASTTETLQLQGNEVTINTGGNGVLKSGGDLTLDDDVTVTGGLDVTGNFTVDGSVTLGDANTDTITTTGELVTTNGLRLTVLNVSTANYLSGVLGIINTGAVAYISDGDAGSPCLGVYNGSSWKRIAFGSDISST